MNSRLKYFVLVILTIFISMACYFSFAGPEELVSSIDESTGSVDEEVGATILTFHWTVDGENCESEYGECTLKITNESINGSHYASGIYYDELNKWSFDAPWENYKSSIVSVVMGREGSIIMPMTMNSFFADCINLTNLDFTYLDTTDLRDLSYTFENCKSFTSLDLSDFKTAKVRKMVGTFYGCENLKILDLSNWNTSQVRYMDKMFCRCKGLESLDLSSFNTTSVEGMLQMFGGCSSLTTLDLNHLDTSNVTNMSEMFYDCTSLRNLDLGTWNTSNVNKSIGMFYGCYFDNLNIANWSSENMNYSPIANSSVKRITIGDNWNFSLPGNQWKNIGYVNAYYTNSKNEVIRCDNITNNMGDTYYNISLLYMTLDDDTLIISNSILDIEKCLGILSNDRYQFDDEVYKNVKKISVGLPNDYVYPKSLYDLFKYFEMLDSVDLTYMDGRYLGEDSHIYTNFVKQIKVGDKSNIKLYAYDWKDTLTNIIYENGDIPKNVSATYELAAKFFYYGVDENDTMYISNYDKFNSEEYIYNGFFEDRKSDFMYKSPFDYYADKVIIGGENDIIKPKYTSNWFTRLWDIEEIDFTYLDTSETIDMSYMFYECNNLNELDVSNFNTSNVKDMSWMFYGISPTCSGSTKSSYKNSGINEKVGGMDCQEGKITEIKGLDNFDTSNVEDMSYMFAYNSKLEKIDLSSFDTRKAKCYEYIGKSNDKLYDCSLMFEGSNNLSEVKVGDNWNFYLPFGNWKNKESGIIYEFDSIPEFTSSTYNKTLAYWAVNDNTLTISNYELEGNVDSGFFSIEVPFEEEAPWTKHMGVIENAIVGGEGDTLKPVFTSNWFAGLENLIDINLTNLDTSNVVDMTYMFVGCINLENLDVSNFNTSNVTTMVGMFEYMRKLKYLDLSSFDTSNVEEMYYMFMGDFDLEEIKGLENFDTSNVYDMEKLFYGCESLTRLDLSNFNFDNVYYYNNMFEECYHLGEIKVSKDNVSYIREYLISPSDEYINGADGLWRNIDGDEYEAYNLPLNVSDTYYAVAPIFIHFDSDGGYDIPDLAKLTNNPLVLPREAKKDSLLEIITTIFETNGGNVINKIETPKITNYEFISFLDETSGITYALGDIYNVDIETTFKISWKSITPIYETINLPMPEKYGYKFTGWSRAADLTDMITGEYIADADRTLYASWEEINYKFIRGSAEQTIYNDTDEYMLLANDILDIKEIVVNNKHLVLDEDYIVEEDKITFTKKGLKYLKSLSSGKYELIATFNNTDKDARAVIYTEKIINPKTGDNYKTLIITIGILALSVISYIVTIKKKIFEL